MERVEELVAEEEINVSELTDEQLEQAMSGVEPSIAETKEDDKTPDVEEVEKIDTVEEELPSIENVLLDKPNIDKKPDAVGGIKRDLLAERDRRRKAEEELSSLKKRLDDVEKLSKKDPVEISDALEDDDVVPFKMVKALKQETDELKKTVSRQMYEFQEKQRIEAEERTANEEKDLRSKYSADKVGEDYSYDNILANEVIPMMEQNPHIADMIRSSKTPALTGYKLGLANKVDPERLVKTKTQPSVAKAKTAPRTLGQIPAGGGASGDISTENITDEMIATMSDEEMDKLMRKLT